MKRLLMLGVVLASGLAASAEFSEVSFDSEDGGRVFANLYGKVYGKGEHAVVLAHGGVFNKESWHAQAVALEARGVQALAIDFRGYGKSGGGKRSKDLYLDVLAAVDYLKAKGASRISILGGSMGGGAVAQAATAVDEDDVHKVVLLAHVPISAPKKMKGDKLFIVTEGDRFAESTRSQFKKAAEPKRLEVLPGNAHAQHIFKTPQAGPLTDLILDFLED